MHTNRHLRACIVIPARLNSSRLPGKVLLAETGKTLIQHTCEAAQQAYRASAVFVCTPDIAVKQAVEDIMVTGLFTYGNHRSGTSRIAEVIQQSRFDEFDIVVNIQADEPMVLGHDIDTLIEYLSNNVSTEAATLYGSITCQQLNDKNVVKVAVTGGPGAEHCIYFSRATLAGAYRHIGVYAYRLKLLRKLTPMTVTPLAFAENLEQLYFLEMGMRIGAVWTESMYPSIDTRADYDAFKQLVLINSENKHDTST